MKTIVLLASIMIGATTFSSEKQPPDLSKTITVEVYTQAGHDEYLEANNNNEAYFLHLTSTWQTDGTVKLIKKATAYLVPFLMNDAAYDKKYLWTFKTPPGQGSRAAEYLFPEAALQAPPAVFQEFQSQLISALTKAASSAGGTVWRQTIFTQDPNDQSLPYNDEYYFQIVFQF